VIFCDSGQHRQLDFIPDSPSFPDGRRLPKKQNPIETIEKLYEAKVRRM
jgi:hypothetical protein